MQIVTNTKLIKRNARIGQITSIVALAILGGGVYISFQMPELFSVSLVALLAGLILSQIGMYFGNRWGKSPRPDEVITKGLKGMDREYTLYHYTTTTYHLLVGPAGLWVLMPYPQVGKVTYARKRWRVKGGGFLQSYLRIFGQEGLGRPDLESAAEIRSLRQSLTRLLPEGSVIPEAQAVMVFTNPRAELDLPEAPPLPALPIKDLKDFLRQQAKGRPIAPDVLAAVKQALPQE
ncbi:MAG: hypothetical protein JXB85_13755 [Anaerolineales bacterium]|nr:hypothetical protein [Anaerolineales bacterium]